MGIRAAGWEVVGLEMPNTTQCIALQGHTNVAGEHMPLRIWMTKSLSTVVAKEKATLAWLFLFGFIISSLSKTTYMRMHHSCIDKPSYKTCRLLHTGKHTSVRRHQRRTHLIRCLPRQGQMIRLPASYRIGKMNSLESNCNPRHAMG